MTRNAFADRLASRDRSPAELPSPIKRQAKSRRGASRFSIINRPTDEDEAADLLLEYKCAYPIYFSHPSQIVDEMDRAEEENIFLLDQMEVQEQQLKDAQSNLDEMKAKAKIKADKLESEQRVLLGRVAALEKSIERTKRELGESGEEGSHHSFEGVAGLLHRILCVGKDKPEKESRLLRSDLASKQTVINQLKALEGVMYRVERELSQVENRDRLYKVD